MCRPFIPSLCSLFAAPVFGLFAQTPLEPILAEAPVETAETTVSPTATAAAPSQAPVNQIAPAAAAGSAPVKLSYSSCSVEGSYVAMTFDDGPHAQNTPRLLDILKQRGIKATFFVVGKNAAEYPDILKRIAEEGHEIANHSFSHPLLASLSEPALREQLDKTHQTVLKESGVTMTVMRPPYGALSDPQRRWTNANFGYKIILWDVDPLDWKFRDAARVETEILNRTRPGSIILSHDIHKTTVDAMPSTLDALTAKGFKFVTVSELLAMDRPATPRSQDPKPTVKAAPKAASSEKKTVSAAPAKSAESPSKKTSSPTSPDKSTSASAGGAPAKPAQQPVQLTQEELRKKWLEGTRVH
jgi:peptidoglycan/xylan/chitin deacetylase (PgdA/CDA1 family)